MAKRRAGQTTPVVHWVSELGSRLCDDAKVTDKFDGARDGDQGHDSVTCVECLRSWIWRIRAQRRAAMFLFDLPTFWVERAVGFDDYTDLCRQFMRPRSVIPLMEWIQRKKPTKRALLSILKPGE